MAQYTDPLRSFRFLVEIESGGAVVAAFSQFSGVRVNVETIRVRPGSDVRGVQEIIPVFTTFDPVTLTKGVIGDNDFLDWLLSAAAGPNTGPRGGGSLYRTLNVIALDDKGNRAVMWSLKNALPIGYQLTPMDGGRSEVLSESLTFAITGMERTVCPPPAAPANQGLSLSLGDILQAVGTAAANAVTGSGTENNTENESDDNTDDQT